MTFKIQTALRSTVLVALAVTLSTGLTACGDDDDAPAQADCSACSDAAKQDCSDTAKECAAQGGAKSDCQQAIDLLCGLSGAFGDAGAGDGG